MCPNDDERSDDWQHELSDVKPLKHKAMQRLAPSAAPVKKKKTVPPAQHFHEPISAPARDLTHLPPLKTGDLSGMDAAAARKMKRGQLPVYATLDLHGLTQNAAFEALNRFIIGKSGSTRRLVLIITGKGAISKPGVLKTNLTHWLNMPELRPYVIAVDHATIDHGGSGAFYVLLRKKPV